MKKFYVLLVCVFMFIIAADNYPRGYNKVIKRCETCQQVEHRKAPNP